MPPTQPLSISTVFGSMKEKSLENRPLFVRLSVTFALLVAVNSLLGLGGGAGIALSLGVSLLLQVIYIGMVSAMVDRSGPASGAGELWAVVRPVLATAVWTALVFFLSVLIGSLLIVLGLVVATIWFVAIQAVVVERLSVFESLRRSQELVRGNFWRVFGVMLCVILFSLGAVLLASLIASPLGTGAAGVAVTSFLIALVVYPFNALAPACTYQLLAAGKTEEQADEPGPPDA